MTITYFSDLIQGSDEWLAARRGLLTASEMSLIVTPTLKAAANDKERKHAYELAAQRISGYVEPSYVGDAMLRGIADEAEARAIYAREYAPVVEVGFITNDRWGFTIGYSPDALVGQNGLLEIKSRKQALQIEALTEYAPKNLIHPDFVIQAQTGLLVSERAWMDHISYSGGLPMVTVRVFPDSVIQGAIIDAAKACELRIAGRIAQYQAVLASEIRTVPTERRVEQEMF